VKRFLQTLLWRLIGRDFIPLNPNWRVINRGKDFGVVGSSALADTRFLPVAYPFGVDENWRIPYELRGERSGTLRFSLSTPENQVLHIFEARVKLPFTLLVERREDRLWINGTEVESQQPLPANAMWLHGDFEFITDSGEKFIRHTAHRVHCDAGTGAGYFKGGAYTDYENDPGIAPHAILDMIARHRPLTGRFLDIGCATGLLVEAAQQRGMNAEGVDFSEWAVEKANVRTGGRCRRMDMDHATAADFTPPYDVVIMHSVIEHLGDPEHALALLFEMTAPGAVIFIQTLNADSLLHKLLGSDWEGYADYTHRSPWITARWLEETGLRLGFEVASLTRSGIWISNQRDEVWRGFSELIQLNPACTLLAQEYGDVSEIILRKPAAKS